MSDVVRFNRRSETQFRTSVPALINNFQVLEVISFRPGGSGVYACAFAITQHSADMNTDRFSTHCVICCDDSPIGVLNWDLMSGHYEFSSRESAFADLVERATGTHLPVGTYSDN
jgi:hypothetical protein